MNFSELYDELIEVLAENSTPQYWLEAELKRYLNRGQRELVKLGHLNTMLLPLSQAETGAFYLPTDVLRLKRVYYAGKGLDHKSVDYLDSAHGGTGHMQMKSGDGNTYTNNWRKEEGIPIHWYFENNKIKLYPKPTSSLTASTVRGKITGTFAVGASGLTLAGSIPLDQNRVDLFINGIYQNKDQWSISTATTIAFTGWSTVYDGTYEVVYIPDSVSMSVITASEKYIVYVAAGQTKVVVPGGYTPGTGSLAVALNGVAQVSTAFSETATGYITLTAAPVVDSIVELTVTRTDPTLTASMLYIQRPTDMSNDADQPLIDNEDWQRGIVHYAAYLALSKEGKMTQDLQKGQIHAQRFNEVVDDILSVSGADIDVASDVEMPFFV